MNFLKKIKEKARVLAAILGISAVVTSAVMPLTTANATAPRFNFLEGDKELLRGANVTKGEDAWHDPVSGNAGDVFAGVVFYHNGKIDTVAKNTRIKVNIPSSTTNKTAVLTASISADNAETVTDTIVNGQVVGKSGLTVNLDQDSELEFVPGSVQWYPNRSTTPVQLPDGRSGDEIVSGAGLNIGDINGCWEFAGHVVFKFKSVKKQPPLRKDIAIDKTVRNLTKGEANYAESTRASANETVEFNIKVTNTGEIRLDNVMVKDTLPSELSFVPGTLKHYEENSSTPHVLTSEQAAEFFGAGFNIGSLNCGANFDRITFEAKTPSSISVEHSVVNTAKVFVGDLSDSDTATVILVPTPVTPGQPNLCVEKLVRNFTNNETSFSESNKAKPGDILEYKIEIKNTGNAAADKVKVVDTLPANVQFIGGSTVISRNGGAEQTLSDGITGDGITLDTIEAGETVVIKFRVVTCNTLANGEVLKNTVFVTDNDKTISDSATTTIVVSVAAIPVKKAEAAPALPKTGGAATASFAITSLGSLIGGIIRYRKRMLADDVQVIKDLLNK